ncbi:hypothetical protein ABZ767_31755, partial [Streptomyces pseudogriseolus]|uniref:hypothetical protein n=1 Tax=Streptomyces pseudogriseolus TaxID=36817 RepID=UPI00346B04AB
MSQQSPSLSTYKARTDLRKYEDNGLLLYAIQLALDVEDIDSLAAVALRAVPQRSWLRVRSGLKSWWGAQLVVREVLM